MDGRTWDKCRLWAQISCQEERQKGRYRDGNACRSGAMCIDNGIRLMSGGRRGYRDKTEG